MPSMIYIFPFLLPNVYRRFFNRNICMDHGSRSQSAMINRYIPTDKAQEVLQNIQKSGAPTVYDHEKHRMILLDEAGDERLFYRLPLVLPPPEPLLPSSGEAALPVAKGVNYVILLIQAGNCAMGYFENGRNLDHKVFRSYMVRKKQGKSQVKYLKTKGKSRAGSRVRLGETVEFFENINERLQQYFDNHEIHRIAISCSKTLIPYLFNAKIPTPFDKRDPRLYKIPRHVHTPIYDVMMDTHKFLGQGELIYEFDQQALADKIAGSMLHHDEEE